jgi:hypothetical protein
MAQLTAATPRESAIIPWWQETSGEWDGLMISASIFSSCAAAKVPKAACLQK